MSKMPTLDCGLTCICCERSVPKETQRLQGVTIKFTKDLTHPIQTALTITPQTKGMLILTTKETEGEDRKEEMNRRMPPW